MSFSGFDPVNAAIIAEEILQLKAEGVIVIFRQPYGICLKM